MLIERLVAGGTELCVVGDDGQAIYQWRGSDVGNITSFVSRYPGVRQFHITTNRRSRRKIIDAEIVFAQTIPGRLDKHMSPYRPTADAPEIVVWGATSEHEEAGQITYLIDELHEKSLSYRDIAVLVRGRWRTSSCARSHCWARSSQTSGSPRLVPPLTSINR